MRARVFKFYIHIEIAKYIVGKKTKMLKFIFAFFFYFSISHSNEIHREICVKDFSGTTLPRILKFDTNVGHVFLYCVKKNQTPAYHSLYLSIFSFSPKFLSQISQLSGARVFKICIHIEGGQLYCG